MSEASNHLRRIEGDLVGAHAFPGPVEVLGTVSAGRLTGSDLRVGGDVAGASIMASGSLSVAGRIEGSAGIRCFAASALACADASDATLIAGERLRVERSITNSRVCCGGAVNVGHAIVGGRTAGNGGISCAVAGSSDGTPTILAAGVDLYFAAVFASQRSGIERDIEAARRTKSEISPLLAQLKTLNPAQKEAVTISICESDQLHQAALEAKSELRKRFERSQGRTIAEIRIEQTLHAGVSVQLGTHQTLIRETLEGPLRLSVGLREEATVIVVQQECKGKFTLPAAPVAAAAAGYRSYLYDEPRVASAA